MTEEITNEIWKDIPEYENFYQISSLGRVKSLERNVWNGKVYCVHRERILKPMKNSDGYLQVVLFKGGIRKSFKIHRLVCNAFLPNPYNLPEVNHINEDKTDNRLENLEFCDHIYNCNFGTRNERAAKGKTNHIKLSKKVKCLETGIVYPSIQEIERQLGFAHNQISCCCNKKYGYKTVKGFHFEWAE